MRRDVAANIYRSLAVTTSQLANICNGNIVQRPETIFIERIDAFLDADLYAVRQQIILSEQVLFLHAFIKSWMFAFS